MCSVTTPAAKLKEEPQCPILCPFQTEKRDNPIQSWSRCAANVATTNSSSIPFYTPMSNPSQNCPLLTHHGNVVVALNNLSDFSHFLLHIAGPDFTDDLTGVCKCSWHVGRSGSERENPNNPAALNKGTQWWTNSGRGQRKKKWLFSSNITVTAWTIHIQVLIMVLIYCLRFT